MASDLRREPLLFAERDLTKSLFLAGLQCPKRLWLEIHRAELAAPPEPVRRAAMAEGVRVGRLARERFPGGRLITETVGAERVTRAALASNVPAIFEAAIRARGVRIRADVLVRRGPGRFDLIEVKSSPRVRAEHELDLALQLVVARRAGLDVEEAAILHLDREYLFSGGALDLERLFVRRSLGERTDVLVPEVEAALERLAPVVPRERAPEIEVGPHCRRPRRCPFFAVCHEDADEERPATPPPTIGERARRAVAGAEAPVRFLDFEAWSPAIPRFARTHPHQALPFLWSMVGEGDEGDDFFATPGEDPRRSFAATLVRALGGRGTIFVDSDFERRTVDELARLFPDLATDLGAVAARMVDLHAALGRGGSGRASPDEPRPRRRFEIRDGGDATAAYAELVDGTPDDDERAAWEGSLRRYCRRDAEAVRRLRDRVRQSA